MLKRIRDTLWPTLEDWDTLEEIARRHENQDDLDDIERADWKTNTDIALVESQRIVIDEDDRRKTAESKATNILLVIAALVSLFTYLEAAFSTSKLGDSPKGVTFVFLVISTAYLLKSAHWSIRAILVGNYHSIATADLVALWKQTPDLHKPKLVEMRLRFTRLNQDIINQRISAVKLAQAFLFRALLGFGCMILWKSTWEIGIWAISAF